MYIGKGLCDCCLIVIVWSISFTTCRARAAVEERVPWAGCGIGIVLGVIIVLADQLLTKGPSVTVRRRYTILGVVSFNDY